MQEEDLALCIDVSCRFHRILEEHKLKGALDTEELAVRLMRAHEAKPLDLRRLYTSDEIDLVTDVTAIVLHFNVHSCTYTGEPPRCLRVSHN